LPDSSTQFPARAGVSTETLRAAGICFSDTPEPGSIVIPYHDLHGKPTGFCRWRLPRERASGQKYHQEEKTGTRAYVPPQFHSLRQGGNLVIVEGEFKALALIDTGIKAIGLPSFNTYVRNENGDCLLLAGIAEAISHTKPERILFLGDSDTATNLAFARNAMFLAKQLKPLPVLLPRIPMDGPGKGIDNCRAELGAKFTEFWSNIADSSERIDLKSGPDALAVRLLEREADALKTSTGSERDANVRRIVHMAAGIREPLAKDRIVSFAEKYMGISRSAFKQAVQAEQAIQTREVEARVKTAAAKKSSDCTAVTKTKQCEATMEDKPSLFPNPPAIPWDKTVDGSELLNDLVNALCRYAVFPAHAAVALAVFILATYATDCFDSAPYINLSSPEKRCGKSLVLRLLSLLCDRALPAANCTEASVFRVIDSEHPCLMIDEVDTFFKDKPQLRGILNAGNIRSEAAVMRTVEVRNDGKTDFEVRRYSVFGPKVYSGIGKLADTLADRCIVVPMKRRRQDEKCDRYRRREFDPEPLRQKCRRWVDDHADMLIKCLPALPTELNDRAADLWEPLLAIADVIGDGWSKKVRTAASALSGEADGSDPTSIGPMLLTDIRTIFDASGADRLASADLCDQLANMEERPWSDFKHGKAIDPNRLARQLKTYAVTSGKIRLGNVTRQGYLRDYFTDAWQRYVPLPAKTAIDQNNGTSAVNTGENGDLEPEQTNPMFHPKTTEIANENAECSSVPLSTQGLTNRAADASDAKLTPLHDAEPLIEEFV
jgi:hypothetical protein